MEAAGFAITVASVASILQTCLEAYRGLNTALAMGDTASAINLRFRVEEMRLRLWGMSRGIYFGLDNGSEDPDIIIPGALASRKRHGSPPAAARDNDVLHIPQMAKLAVDILGRIFQVLENYSQVMEKQGIPKPVVSTEVDEGRSLASLFSPGRIEAAKAAQGEEAKSVSKKTPFGAKIRWAVRDKQVLTDLLDELTTLNDGLQNLLPREDAVLLCRGLAAEAINEESTDLTDITIESFGGMGRKAAAALEIRQENLTNLSEKASPFSTKPLNEDCEPSYLIPISCFPDFTEPRLKYRQTIEGQFGNEALEVPLVRTYQTFVPLPPTAGSNSAKVNKFQRPEVVLVEWRSQEAESKYSTISAEALARRRDHLVSLLHRTATSDDEYRVLNCLGYCLTSGRLPDGETHPIVGFVYRLPDGAANHVEPISLRAILGEAFAATDPHIPNLDDRYQLAWSLAVSLYQLQCAGWIHRKISSHNVLFFKDKARGQIDINQPYVCGWQYARPDSYIPGYKPSIYESESRKVGSLGDLDMYAHPRRLDYVKGIPRFRKSFDIYSLGIILIEIAFWEPIVAFADVEKRTLMERFYHPVEPTTVWASKIRAAAEKEIGPEMGLAYRDAVLACLGGLKMASLDDILAVEDIDMKNIELGIEREFFWRVVHSLRLR
ncbi:prion-inhibition and propagation-domain-containing protein [Durotheca rogersii]|uniref:prion-inhibition and propagation-domain-containing protein n=1 Tax=Durotheca rogersii TaxID=419775 RepID=UPI0022203DFD|nr:prion-inhibition and propagation-domain-containing protein [Durotheca rogersii]KAI5861908.1 prion-inhibition and propagation-domain-containing protein [Durotheca rogersii]